MVKRREAFLDNMTKLIQEKITCMPERRKKKEKDLGIVCMTERERIHEKKISLSISKC